MQIKELKAKTKESDNGIDHRIIIEYSCDLYSIYIQITELSETIESQLEWKFSTEDSKGQSVSRVPVKQGQVIGRASGRESFDLSVVDTRVTLDGFVSLDSYAGEFWKFRTVDPKGRLFPSRGYGPERWSRSREPGYA